MSFYSYSFLFFFNYILDFIIIIVMLKVIKLNYTAMKYFQYVMLNIYVCGNKMVSEKLISMYLSLS